MNDVANVLRKLGGGAKVARDIGITKQAVNSWRVKNKIPKAWEKYLKVKHPEAFKQGDGNAN